MWSVTDVVVARSRRLAHSRGLPPWLLFFIRARKIWGFKSGNKPLRSIAYTLWQNIVEITLTAPQCKQRLFVIQNTDSSLVPRLHCPAFFAHWKNTCPYFSKMQKIAGQWSLGTRLTDSRNFLYCSLHMYILMG